MAKPRRNLDLITLSHLRTAARIVGADGLGYPPFRRSTHYDARLPRAQTPYPPKALIACAYELATGKLLVPSDFAGAWEGFYLNRLRDLGCRIDDKPSRVQAKAASSPRQHGSVAGAFTGTQRTTVADDVQSLLARAGVSTEVQREVLARLGQGTFRRKLERRWECACALTGLAEPAVLRAAHIKRWADSDHTERLDADNGLLLRADIDALFEVGLIRFADDGRIDLTRLSEATVQALGLKRTMRLRDRPNAAQRAYLQQHRARFV